MWEQMYGCTEKRIRFCMAQSEAVSALVLTFVANYKAERCV
jgi:hypothetical protein